jgi:hypothetical protein
MTTYLIIPTLEHFDLMLRESLAKVALDRSIRDYYSSTETLWDLSNWIITTSEGLDEVIHTLKHLPVEVYENEQVGIKS